MGTLLAMGKGNPSVVSCFIRTAENTHEDLVLSSYNIPSGSQVAIMLYAIGRNESIFVDAHRFKPERWLRHHQDECD